MSLFKKLFRPRKPVFPAQPKVQLRQLVAGQPQLRGQLTTTHAGYFAGDLEGPLTATEELWIEPDGKVKGDVRGTYLSVEGNVNGEIRASGVVTLKERCQVRGDVRAVGLNIEAGAHYQGLLVIGGTEAELALNLKSKH